VWQDTDIPGDVRVALIIFRKDRMSTLSCSVNVADKNVTTTAVTQ